MRLQNTTTREGLAADGTWGVGISPGWFRVSPLNLNASTYSWSWTTPFNLTPGSYDFRVRATDDIELTTSTAQQGRLTLAAQIPGDNPPDALLDVTGTQTGLQVLHLDLTGTATDDHGVDRVRVAFFDNDTRRYLQANGTLSASYADLAATLASPAATSTTWSLSQDLPVEGDRSVTAYAWDTVNQQDPRPRAPRRATRSTRETSHPPSWRTCAFRRAARPTPRAGSRSPDGWRTTGPSPPSRWRCATARPVHERHRRLHQRHGELADGLLELARLARLELLLHHPRHSSGDYVVRVRGVDNHDFVTDPSLDATVTVTQPPNNPPVASFTVNCTDNICGFDGRSSTDENPSALTYSWNFGNGTGSGAFVSRTYTSANTYTVTLTVTDEYLATSTATQTVTITEPPDNVAPNAVIGTPTCTARTCSFTSSQSSDPNAGDSITRLWDFGDGGATSTSTSPTRTFPADGTYTVTLTVTDGWGKSSTVTRTVVIQEPAGNRVPIAVIDPPACTALVCTFSSAGSSTRTGTRSPGSGTSETAGAPAPRPARPAPSRQRGLHSHLDGDRWLGACQHGHRAGVGQRSLGARGGGPPTEPRGPRRRSSLYLTTIPTAWLANGQTSGTGHPRARPTARAGLALD
ncbi:MAG: PKD domain-containing protein [Nocardioides sp.]